jgi:hypothetical protein
MRRRAVVAMLALCLLRTPAAAAQNSLSEDEVYSFIHRFFDALTVCDADQVERFCDRSATFQFGYTHHPSEQLSLAAFLKRMRKHCQPYSTYDWDSLSWNVSVQGLEASARTTLDWGGKDPLVGTPGPPKVQVKQTIGMKRQGEGVLITRVSESIRELQKGGEKAYLAKYSQASLLGNAVKWYNGAIEFMKAMWEKGDVKNR